MINKHERERISARLEELRKEWREDIKFNEERIASVDPKCEASGLQERKVRVGREIAFWMYMLEYASVQDVSEEILYLEEKAIAEKKLVEKLKKSSGLSQEILEGYEQNLISIRRLFP